MIRFRQKLTQEDKTPHSSAALIIKRGDGKLLVMRNTKFDMLTCPIGKAHPEEKPEDAMKREVMEELGFTPRGYKFLGVFHNKVSYLPSPIPVSIFEMLGEPRYRNLEPEKCNFIGWMSPIEILESGKNYQGL